MKKLTALLLALIMCLSFAACGGGIDTSALKNHISQKLTEYGYADSVEFSPEESIGDKVEFTCLDGTLRVRVKYNGDEMVGLMVAAAEEPFKHMGSYKQEYESLLKMATLITAFTYQDANVDVFGSAILSLYEIVGFDEILHYESDSWEYDAIYINNSSSDYDLVMYANKK